MLLLAPSCCGCFLFVVGITFTGVHDLCLVHVAASIHAVAGGRCSSVDGPTVTDVHALLIVHALAGTHAIARFLLLMALMLLALLHHNVAA
jgi:hypothetical protein